MNNIKNLFTTDYLFFSEIEDLSKSLNIEYIDAVVLWCEKNKLEVETVALWIKKEPVLKAKIQAEAENLNFLKKSAHLPI